MDDGPLTVTLLSIVHGPLSRLGDCHARNCDHDRRPERTDLAALAKDCPRSGRFGLCWFVPLGSFYECESAGQRIARVVDLVDLAGGQHFANRVWSAGDALLVSSSRVDGAHGRGSG